jgi:hypothetical protein
MCTSAIDAQSIIAIYFVNNGNDLKDYKAVGSCTVIKSEPNEASLWKITLQKRENSHVDAGTFIPPLTRFLYIFQCGKSVPVYGRGHFTGLRR